MDVDVDVCEACVDDPTAATGEGDDTGIAPAEDSIPSLIFSMLYRWKEGMNERTKGQDKCERARQLQFKIVCLVLS